MIEVKNLTKRYGSVEAVSNLSFTIEKGHIYGFLGPNGAGKSTTMNIITGCLAASSGDVLIGGYDIFEQPLEAKRLIGYLPEMPPLYLEQTPREYLDFVAAAKGVSKADRPSEIEKVISETKIADVADRLIRNLSKGYKQRVGIAQALLGNPEVIILDEPTVGLDPVQIIEIRDLIKALGESHTVILSSHILAEVQAICDEILIIHKGKLIAFDKPENLEKSLAGGNSVDLIAEVSLEELDEIVAKTDGLEVVRIDSKDAVDGFGHFVLTLGGQDLMGDCRKLSMALASAGKLITGMTPVKASLEDIFIELTAASETAPVSEGSPEAKEAEN